jgi:hypothetical protein
MDSKDSNNKKPKIEVERRRRHGVGGATDKPRAKTPQRREQPSPGSSQTPEQTPSSTQHPGSTGGQIPVESLIPLLKRLPWWAVLLIACVFIGFMVFSMNNGENIENAAYIQRTQPQEIVQPSVQPIKFPLVSSPAGENTWLHTPTLQ